MRKSLLLFCAVTLSFGQTVIAQTLSTSKTLPCERSKGEKAPVLSPPSSKTEVSAESVGYWVDAVNYYDAQGQFSITNGEKKSFRADLLFSGDQVTIANLFDTSDWYGISTYYDVTGTYDASKKTITISTPTYQEGAKVDHYTIYGDMTYYGEQCFIALLSGDFNTTPDNQGKYSLNMNNKLVFDVDDDLTTLTPRTGFGLWAFSESDGSSVGSLMFYTKNSTLIQMPNEPLLAVEPDTLVFEGASVSVGATLKRNYTLINKGLAEATVTADVYANGMEVAVPRTIGGGQKIAGYVSFKPQAEGSYSGYAKIYANNGVTSTQLNFKGTVNPAPDFSQVIKEGSGTITFSQGDNYPFAVTDTITGFPVAVSTNVGSNTQSQIIANFYVPAGKIGLFSWKGIKEGSYSNGVKITLNEDSTITDDTYSHGMDATTFKDDISNTLVLTEGSYSVEYNNDLQADWFNDGNKSLRTYLWDFNLEQRDKTAHDAMLKNDNLDFGSHYYDNLSVRDTLTAYLVNLGTEPLKVTGIEGEGTFSGIIPNQEAVSYSTLPVAITYEAKDVSEYTGEVVIKTNAGDFSVNCKAKNEALPVSYQPIVKSGSFSFNTSDPYPFSVEADTAYNSTAGMDNNNKNSYLEASFEVPEGKVGKLSWNAKNYSYDFFTFMNETVLTTGTRITIDGGKMKEFANQGTDASSTNWSDEDLTLTEGRHTVRFYYKKSDSTPPATDKVKIYNLALDVTSGINQVNGDKSSVVRTEIFNLSGQAQNGLQRGVNIVRRIHADGSTSTQKVLMK